ncbi:MAG: class I SAM-dependent methyltransferase [Trichlorobacter sp.]|uniref:class I SAM-dependent methyltransferase n=1 Tax=Trichlorobacter sp. TaxID=2911007 RepID=UPI0025642ED9|nr:class I SAM-dependent methyltransferase [Trichlorobacter sp.]MDK9719001.1 class I SAM-dependent methyltransferase [Trichlorobacter sp.]
MAKQGEIDYIDNIGTDGAYHAQHKPYSDPRCGNYFLDLGAIFLLLPPPPARLLDLGVGTGWTSILFAQRGYQVIGQDIAPAMIELAHQNRQKAGTTNVDFLVSDYESLDMPEQFDCAVFYDSLHHAVDEQAALTAVYQSLKPGGICITVEPGKDHHLSHESQYAVKTFGVTEKEMHPGRIISCAKNAGFSDYRVIKRPHEKGILFESSPQPFSERCITFMGEIHQAFRKLCRTPSLLNAGNIVVLHKQ